MWCFVRNGRRFRILGALCLVLCLLLTGCRAERARRTLSDAALSPVATPPAVLQPVPTYTPTPAPVAAEREALVSLYQATQGPDWAVDPLFHWRREVPLDRWTGVTFNAQGQVKGLALAGVGLRGQVPAALGQLTALAALDLAANRLYGPLPRELGQLSLLQTLQLGGNAWTGCLPAAWRDLRLRQSDIGELGLPYCDTEVKGSYDDPVTHWAGSYQLQRRETQITATLRTTRAPLPAAGAAGLVLFTLPPGFWPGTPYTRLVWGHGVREDGRPGGSSLEPRRGRLQVAADGTVRLVVAEGAPVPGYWAYTVTAAWEVAPAGDPPPRPADPEETTPLHAAAAAGQADVVRQLLTAGAALEAGDNRDRTPLHHAAGAGHVEVVELLLAAGAALEARDEPGSDPAAPCGGGGPCRGGGSCCWRRGPTWRPGIGGMRLPLQLCGAGGRCRGGGSCCWRRERIVAAQDRSRQTPLHHATEAGHVEVVAVLLAAGAEVNDKWATPLQRAAGGGM